MSNESATTAGVRVSVQVRYSDQHSAPTQGRWFYLYTVTIENEGEHAVQLLSRHWVIQDAHGEVEEVKGPGVVGEQPVLGPGSRYEYTSGCPLGTPFGSMHGSYQMVDEDGREFDARIPAFALRRPEAVN